MELEFQTLAIFTPKKKTLVLKKLQFARARKKKKKIQWKPKKNIFKTHKPGNCCKDNTNLPLQQLHTSATFHTACWTTHRKDNTNLPLKRFSFKIQISTSLIARQLFFSRFYFFPLQCYKWVTETLTASIGFVPDHVLRTFSFRFVEIFWTKSL